MYARTISSNGLEGNNRLIHLKQLAGQLEGAV